MLENIKEAIKRHQFEYGLHAVDQSTLRKITVTEMREAVNVGEIIENYPEDKYGPS